MGKLFDQCDTVIMNDGTVMHRDRAAAERMAKTAARILRESRLRTLGFDEVTADSVAINRLLLDLSLVK